MEYDPNGALLNTNLDSVELINRGKVRDLYALDDDTILFVATDRISAFDAVMPNGIPDKGKILTQLSLFWFEKMGFIENHLVSSDVATFPKQLEPYAEDLRDRSIIVKKAEPFPVECIVRGYITGSGWKDYLKCGQVCGIPLRAGYRQAEKLDEPLFTPSTKAEQGLHDENISFDRATEVLGKDIACQLAELSLKVYRTASDYAETKDIILADTKFEFGLLDGKIILIDEVLTPDSSRFWPKNEYKIDCSPPSLDKQFVRDYLETLDWGKTPPAPELPEEVVMNTRLKYLEAYRLLVGEDFSS